MIDRGYIMEYNGYKDITGWWWLKGCNDGMVQKLFSHPSPSSQNGSWLHTFYPKTWVPLPARGLPKQTPSTLETPGRFPVQHCQAHTPWLPSLGARHLLPHCCGPRLSGCGAWNWTWTIFNRTRSCFCCCLSLFCSLYLLCFLILCCLCCHGSYFDSCSCCWWWWCAAAVLRRYCGTVSSSGLIECSHIVHDVSPM